MSDQATLPEHETTIERLDHLEEEVRRYRLSRDSWTLIVFALLAVVAIGAMVTALRDGGSAAPAGPPGTDIHAELSEFEISLSAQSVERAGTLHFTNAGSMVHNIRVVGNGFDLQSDDVDPGDSAALDLSDLTAGTYAVSCEIAGHEASGMVTTLVVGDPSAAAVEAAADGHGDHGGMTEEEAAAMDEAMIASVAAFPAATEGLGNQPLAPTVLPDGTKRFELTASIIDWEVEPGVFVKAWAYNGMVPGPRIDLEVGDAVEVQITNELPVGTDIHWHGIDVPNDQDGVAPITQELVMPGESYTYRYTVTEDAIGMYHAHAHGEVAVPNGLFGTMYVGQMDLPAGETISGVEIPNDLEVAQRIPMVLNDAGEIGLTLDGKSFPATTPVTAEAGDWLEVTYFNEGLQVHPMHLHGFEQFVVAKDGEELDHPYAADTILVAPGERYTVLINPTDAGTWVWHCHILNHVESADGMFGMVTALIVT